LKRSELQEWIGHQKIGCRAAADSAGMGDPGVVCTGSASVVAEGVWFAWLAISVAIVVAAWKGLLLGARQRHLASVNAPVA
jgi:hypothetical protein